MDHFITSILTLSQRRQNDFYIQISCNKADNIYHVLSSMFSESWILITMFLTLPSPSSLQTKLPKSLWRYTCTGLWWHHSYYQRSLLDHSHKPYNHRGHLRDPNVLASTGYNHVQSHNAYMCTLLYTHCIPGCWLCPACCTCKLQVFIVTVTFPAAVKVSAW
jgi:hypothetical protein